jgi:hypothetical protein
MNIRSLPLAALALALPATASAEESHVGIYNFVVEISGISVARGSEFVSEHDAREAMGAQSAKLMSSEDGSGVLLTDCELFSDELLWAWYDALEGEETATSTLFSGEGSAEVTVELASMRMLMDVPDHGPMLVDTAEEVAFIASEIWPHFDGLLAVAAVYVDYHENYLGRNINTGSTS